MNNDVHIVVNDLSLQKLIVANQCMKSFLLWSNLTSFEKDFFRFATCHSYNVISLLYRCHVAKL